MSAVTGAGPAPSAANGRMAGRDRRHQLCTVARGLFLVNGYRGTTTRAVAEAAGVSEALLIKHFGSKEALFREAVAEPVIDVLRQAVASNRDQAGRDGGGVADHMARLEQFGVTWAELIRQHGPVLAAALQAAADFPDVVAELEAMFVGVIEEIAESLEGLTAGEEYRPFDRKVAAYAGLAGMGIAPLVTADVAGYMEEFVRMLMLGILSPSGRRQVTPELMTQNMSV